MRAEIAAASLKIKKEEIEDYFQLDKPIKYKGGILLNNGINRLNKKVTLQARDDSFKRDIPFAELKVQEGI